jgi:hypothetical protein
MGSVYRSCCLAGIACASYVFAGIAVADNNPPCEYKFAQCQTWNAGSQEGQDEGFCCLDPVGWGTVAPPDGSWNALYTTGTSGCGDRYVDGECTDEIVGGAGGCGSNIAESLCDPTA